MMPNAYIGVATPKRFVLAEEKNKSYQIYFFFSFALVSTSIRSVVLIFSII